jgi:nucleobase:cation symporter-1, NCS1 family
VQRRTLLVSDLNSMDPDRRYHCVNGWNLRAIAAFAVAAVFSVATVWVPWLAELSGFAWVIGAVIGAVLYIAAMAARTPGAFDRAIPVSPAPVTTAPTTAQTSSS